MLRDTEVYSSLAALQGRPVTLLEVPPETLLPLQGLPQVMEHAGHFLQLVIHLQANHLFHGATLTIDGELAIDTRCQYREHDTQHAHDDYAEGDIEAQ